jgi:hypothetical protein
LGVWVLFKVAAGYSANRQQKALGPFCHLSAEQRQPLKCQGANHPKWFVTLILRGGTGGFSRGKIFLLYLAKPAKHYNPRIILPMKLLRTTATVVLLLIIALTIGWLVFTKGDMMFAIGPLIFLGFSTVLLLSCLAFSFVPWFGNKIYLLWLLLIPAVLIIPLMLFI